MWKNSFTLKPVIWQCSCNTDNAHANFFLGDVHFWHVLDERCARTYEDDSKDWLAPSRKEQFAVFDR